MSFGAAASRDTPKPGFPRVRPTDPCPCGSGGRYDGCCGPLLQGAPAPSAERLMRSRYTAFVVGDSRYLSDTWHPGTRPDDLELDPSQRWTGLQIVAVEAGGPGDPRGVVEFRAEWRSGRERGVLEERSRFVHRGERWWYLDGNVA
ncbi:YchJ family protein [Microbacterium sp. CFBP9034]|uniref:YchJ family protein n=1 Tax=Microbacterium sp. CFBP9034 TaxID=3096540 RepID=UPI002A69A9C9|nr:YchJ family metal-binding protein [Microbacterium sp. CFBP9034]MDY0909944.1 YchJ family metal-binding protein [Microbacterium sp. CFBP9034]